MNSIQVGQLQLANVSALHSATLNTGVVRSLQQGYRQALTAQQANGPILTAPVSGPGVYAGTDGKNYLVPLAKLAYRANLPQTPNIAFKSDGKNWTLLLTIELRRPPGATADAMPLLMDNYRVDIQSGDQTPSFTFSKVTALEAPSDSSEVVGLLKAEGVIDETLALSILRDKPGAHLDVVGSLSYRHNVVHRSFPPVPDPPRPRGPALPLLRAEMLERSFAVPVQPATMLLRETTPIRMAGVGSGEVVTTTVIEGVTADQVVTNNEKMCFPSDTRDYKPIYAEILGVGSDGTVWSQQTAQGYSRPSSNSDGYYVLPDSFRLAVDASTGLPSVNLLLITNPPATPGGNVTYGVRVRLAIAPLLDGARLERMRAEFRRAENIPYTHLSIGGYSSAVFVPSAMFSTLPGFQSGVVNSAAATSQIDAANGFELVMDCSLEFYTLLSKLLCSADGLQGTVQFQVVTSHIDSTPPVETTLLVSVPVVLSLVGPFAVQPLAQLDSAQSAEATATSIAVSIKNPLAVPLSITGLFPTLLQTDPDLQMTDATVLSPSQDQMQLAGGASGSLSMKSADGKPLPAYSTLITVFGTTVPSYDSNVLLNHYHELVGGTNVNASAHFECYLLKHVDQIPPSLANLLAMQVEVQHGTGAIITVPLTRDVPAADVNIPYTFQELLAGVSLDQPTFQYRAKCIYPDHAGPLSDWTSNTGRNVLVTPIS